MTVGAMIPAQETPSAPVEPSYGVNWKALGITVAVAGLLALGDWKQLAVFLGFLITIIVLHELGHFLAARWTGMRVTEFFVGFGPPSTKIWSFKRGETEYGIKAILAGGYVKTPGLTNLEAVEPEFESRTYRAATFPRRAFHIVAGPGMNLLLALVSFCFFYATATEDRFVDGARQTIEVAPGAPGERAGLRTNDVIVDIDGISQAGRQSYIDYIKARPGSDVLVGVERDGARLEIPVTLAEQNPDLENVGYLGAFLGGQVEYIEPRGFAGGIGRGADEFGTQVVGTVKGIGQIFSPSGISRLFQTVTGAREDDGQRASSVFGIAKTGSEFVTSSDRAVYYFAVLNLAIGMFNLLPLVPFDGGHLAIAIYERLRSRRGVIYRVDFARVVPYFAPFLVIIVFVVASAMFLDLKM